VRFGLTGNPVGEIRGVFLSGSSTSVLASLRSLRASGQ